MKKLEKVLGRELTQRDIAGHIADCISAQEQIARIALIEGDMKMKNEATENIRQLRQGARQYGLSQEQYPGLYR